MISLFSMIMCLGIVVDDTVVVAERIYAYFEEGMKPFDAAINGAKDMVRPIMASSMTTVGAFVPLLILDGLMGDILRIIPITAIVVIIASLFECFFILPTHMYYACQKIDITKQSFIIKVQQKFSAMRDYFCDHILSQVLTHPLQTVLLFFSIVLVTVALITTGRMPFDFFPEPDQPNMNIEIDFHPQTEHSQQQEVIREVMSLSRATQDDGKDVVEFIVPVSRQAIGARNALTVGMDTSQKATLLVQLTKPDSRKLTNDRIMQMWPREIKKLPGVRDVVIRSEKGGPPAKDFYAMLYGAPEVELYAAAKDLIGFVGSKQGAYNVRELRPEQELLWVIQPNDLANELGVGYDQLANELRAASSGLVVKQVQDPKWGKTDIEVRLAERIPMPEVLQHIPVRVGQQTYQLADLVSVHQAQNRAVVEAYNGQVVVAVEASLDKSVVRSSEMKQIVKEDWLRRFPQVKMSFSEQDRYQNETFESIQWSILLGFVLIFIVIAWVTGSIMWPVVIMLSIPFGLIGGIWLHKLLGLSVTLLSIFGFFRKYWICLII